MAAILALVARGSRPLGYRYVAATTAVVLSMLYLGLEVRTLYHGAILTSGVTSDAEQYTYSAVWLIFGILLLIAGFLLRSQPAHLASAAVTAFTIVKVFVIDMAALTGIFRALSFIGLGIVLVGIGLLYQRLLFPAEEQGYNVGRDRRRKWQCHERVTHYGVVTPETLKTYDGLGFAKAIVDGSRCRNRRSAS